MAERQLPKLHTGVRFSSPAPDQPTAIQQVFWSSLMKVLKWIAIVVVVYAGIVVLFESLLGYFQPMPENTLVITTFDESGEGSNRVLAHLQVDETTYVAVNHWPRAWYRKALANPKVEITVGDETSAYTAIEVSGEEYDRVNNAHSLGLGFRILTGFPPRYILRMDPR
jgi:hypothetical protein